jgi:hypothetical protein
MRTLGLFDSLLLMTSYGLANELIISGIYRTPRHILHDKEDIVNKLNSKRKERRKKLL